jgi:DNA-binding NtrC family response regulator
MIRLPMADLDRKTIIQTGVATSSTAGRSPPRAWTCKVTSGDQAGRNLSIGARPVTVGADAGCDLVLSDPTVSRRHAEIRVTTDGVEVRDLGSTNGTFYRSSRISEVVLRAEGTIRIGKTKLHLSATPRPTVPPSSRRRFGGLVGESLPMREVFAVLELASPTDATVIIEGESGTGKELAARAIHDHSPRAEKPFVVVDCSATQEQLIDSHLYGHVRGAFTGAVSSRRGAFAEAGGGTVFLDEIGELPLGSQAKLLRAIEAQTVQPLGSDRSVRVDARVVAATNRDLNRMVEEGTFRFDLYQRLAVVHIRIPPLRERLEDLSALIVHFYEGRGAVPGPIGGENLKKMEAHDWPGNVRELRNVLERAWVMGGTGTMGNQFASLQPWMQMSGRSPPAGSVDTTLSFKEAKEHWNQEFERRYLAAVFQEYGGNISRAARHAGINRNHLRKLLVKYGLLDS